MTTALTYLFLDCLAGSERSHGWLPVIAFLAALCKPAYFLVALLVVVIPASRLRRPWPTRLMVLAATVSADGGKVRLSRCGAAHVVVWLEVGVLIVAAAAATGCGPWGRVLALAIAAGTVASIAFTMYIGWSRPCALAIEGIQGRYLLPIVPLLLAAFSARVPVAERVAPWLVAAVALVATAVSLFTIGSRYYGTI